MLHYRTKDKIAPRRKFLQYLDIFREIRTVSTVIVFFGSAILMLLAGFVFQTMRSYNLKRHRITLANLQLEVFDGVTASGLVSSNRLEDRMRACLPRLEAMARLAPSNDSGITNSTLASWRVQLHMEDGLLPKPIKVWDRIHLAQRLVALGNAKDASAMLEPLRKLADPSKTWATAFWFTVIRIDQLQGDRSQGWKDFAEYRVRFEQQASLEIERMMAGI